MHFPLAFAFLFGASLLTPHHHHLPPADTHLYDSAAAVFPPHARNVAAYYDGAYAANIKALHKTHRHVLSIDVNASAPQAGALDIEPGDATPAQAAGWVRRHVKVGKGPARLYFPPTDTAAVKASVATLPRKIRLHVRYWIASPTGAQHELPGANSTQYAWGKTWDASKFHGDFMKGTG